MAAVAPAIDLEFPRWRIAIVIGAAVAFYAATMYDVATRREDWPISPYPMYSDMPGTTASRWTINGVSEAGEFKLDDAQTAPFHGSRLLSINKSLERHPAKRSQFIRKLVSHYESEREREKWPELHAIRFYRETWDLREYANGVDRPEKQLVSAMYLPPSALLERLNAEASGKAAPEPAVAAVVGDVVVDLSPAQCEASCTAFSDALAAGGKALRLTPASGPASTTVRVELAAGRYFVFVRMRTAADAGRDHVGLDLDAQSAGEIGNYRSDLPGAGWVWASASPATPPLELEIKQAGYHALRLSSANAVDLDELWLSRSVRELPIDNRARQP
jgi:hypothetical protein